MGSIADLLPWFFHYGYVALFFIMALGEFYLPVPSNLGLLAAGALSHLSQGGVHFNIAIAAVVAFVGSTVGDVASYWIARRFENKRQREKFEARHKSFRKISHYLKKHPVLTISVSRLIGFLSPIVNSLAGFTKLSFGEFLGADVLGNAVYVFLYMGAGYLLGDVQGTLVTLLAVGTAILVVIALSYIAAIVFLKD